MQLGYSKHKQPKNRRLRAMLLQARIDCALSLLLSRIRSSSVALNATTPAFLGNAGNKSKQPWHTSTHLYSSGTWCADYWWTLCARTQIRFNICRVTNLPPARQQVKSLRVGTRIRVFTGREHGCPTRVSFWTPVFSGRVGKKHCTTILFTTGPVNTVINSEQELAICCRPFVCLSICRL